MNLTKTSELARRVISITLFLAVSYTLVYFSVPNVKDFYKIIFPPKPKPSMLFGIIPKIKVFSLPINSEVKPSYVLNTKDGRLPSIAEATVNVYKVIKPPVSFGGRRAQTNAALLGFTGDPLPGTLSTNVLKWADVRLSRQLEINTSTNTIEYFVNLPANRTKLQATPTLGVAGTVNEASSLLKNLGYFKDPLYGRGSQKITFGKVLTASVPETITPQEFMLAKVGFFRTIYKVPIVGPRFDDGMLEVTVTKPTEDDNLLRYAKVSAHEWSIVTNLDKVGKYPPVSIGEAWKQVQNNNGIFSKVKLKGASVFEPYEKATISKVSIQNIYLAYLDSLEFQEYMQPIYVFEGTFLTPENRSGSIVIYYPAIDPSYLK